MTGYCIFIQFLPFGKPEIAHRDLGHSFRIALHKNEPTQRLGACAALVAIPTFAAGSCEVNFKYKPEPPLASGYPPAIGVIVTLDNTILAAFFASLVASLPRRAYGSTLLPGSIWLDGRI